MKQYLRYWMAYLPVVSLLTVWASLFFVYGVVQRIALIVAGVSFVADYVVNRRWKHWAFSRDKWVFVVSIVFFMLVPIWVAVGIDDGPDVMTYVERMLPFLVFGVVGLMGCSKAFRTEYFAVVGLSVVAVVTVWILGQCKWSEMFRYWHCAYSEFNTLRLRYSDSHMRFNLYANMSMVLGVLSLWKRDVHPVVKWVIGVEMAISLFAVSMSEGRAGVASMAVVMALSVFYYAWHYNHKWGIVVGFLGCMAGGGLVYHTTNNHYRTSLEDPRIAIWHVACEQIQAHPILGYGLSAGHQEFVKRCVEDEGVQQCYLPLLYSYEPDAKDTVVYLAHPHNLFLEIAIAFGVLGVLLLMALLVSPILFSHHQQRFAALLCLCVFVGQAFFEHLGGDLNPMLLLIALMLISKRIDGDVIASEALPKES